MDTCKECSIELKIGENWHSSYAAKKYYICVPCLKLKSQLVYKENKVKIKNRVMNQYSEDCKKGSYKYGTRKWGKNHLASLRYRDKKTYTEVCDVTLEELFEIIKKPCTYCGDTEDQKGLDRVDNDRGHVKDNVVSCCYLCNTARMASFTFEEMKILGKAIKQIRQQRS